MAVNNFIGNLVDEQIKLRKEQNPNISETVAIQNWLDGLSEQNIVTKIADKEYICQYEIKEIKEAA